MDIKRKISGFMHCAQGAVRKYFQNLPISGQELDSRKNKQIVASP